MTTDFDELLAHAGLLLDCLLLGSRLLCCTFVAQALDRSSLWFHFLLWRLLASETFDRFCASLHHCRSSLHFHRCGFHRTGRFHRTVHRHGLASFWLWLELHCASVRHRAIHSFGHAAGFLRLQRRLAASCCHALGRLLHQLNQRLNVWNWKGRLVSKRANAA